MDLIPIKELSLLDGKKKISFKILMQSSNFLIDLKEQIKTKIKK